MIDPISAMPSPLQQALVMACLADGRSRLSGTRIDAPTRLLIENLLSLGVAIVTDADSGSIDVAGTGGYWPNSDAELDCGESFLLACLLAAGCSIGRGQYTVVYTAPPDGAGPFAPLLGSLLDLGATVSHDHIDGRIAVNLGPTALRGGTTEIAAAAPACVLASLLLIAPYALTDVFVSCRGPAAQEVEPLLMLMDRFAVPAIQDGPRFIIPAPQRYLGLEIVV
jgi:5-enolpyruvylshikimate-3-phosphate synthase